LSRFGIWDQTPFLNQIRNQRFALVLLKFDISRDVSSRNIVTAEMVEALRANYALEEKMWLYYVYVPRLASDR